MNPAPPTQPPPSYSPPENELRYYEGLFHNADVSQSGEINGRDSVAFLSKSKLPLDLLKNIWAMVDQNPKTNTLDKKKFFAAVRLIQLFQNGQKASGPMLQCADPNVVMRPPFFEGVTGPIPPPFTNAPSSVSPVPQTTGENISTPPSPQRDGMGAGVSMTGMMAPASSMTQPPPQQPPQPQVTNPIGATTALTQDPYMMLPGEQVRYESIFPQYEKDGFVHGPEAVALFTKSGLSNEVLRDIWNVVDDPIDNQLSKIEFAIAMHMIVCVSKKNLPVPPSLPPSLKLLKEREDASSVGASQRNVGGFSASMTSNTAAPPSPPTPQRVTMSAAPPAMLSSQVSAGSGMNYNNTAALNHIPDMNQANGGSGGGGGGYAGGYNTANLENERVSITDAFSNLQAPGAASVKSFDSAASASSNKSPTTVPNSMKGTSNISNHHSAEEELQKVQSVLQKLQAENVSLKAQLGQYSDEEKSVRNEITRTVAEIGALSQELTSLRSQVVASKASLIEASAELKALIEKRDLLKSLVGETVAMIDALDMGKESISQAHAVAMENKAKIKEQISHAPSQNAHHFGYSDMDGLSVGTGSVQSTQLSAQNVSSVATPQRAQVNHNDGLYYSAPPTYAPPNHAPPAPPPTINEPSPEALQQLHRMKQEAEHAEKQLQSAKDYAQAISLQFEDVKSEAERLTQEAEEKMKEAQKKKGKFRGGNKKAAKKEAEDAQQKAMFKGDEVQQLQYRLQQAEDQIAQLKHKAETMRSNADSFEMELANQVTQAQSQSSVPTETFSTVYGTQSYSVASVDPFNPYSNVGVSPSQPSHNRQYSEPGMGYGGNPSTPSRPASKQLDDTSSLAHSSIYDQYNESGSLSFDQYGLSIADSTSYADLTATGSEDVYANQIQNQYSLMGGTAGSFGSISRSHGGYGSDTGYQSLHSTGVSQSGPNVLMGSHTLPPSDNSLGGSLSYTDASASVHHDSGWSYGGSVGKPPSPVPENSAVLEPKSFVVDHLPRNEYTNHSGYDTSSSIQGSVSRAGTITSVSEHRTESLKQPEDSSSMPSPDALPQENMNGINLETVSPSEPIASTGDYSQPNNTNGSIDVKTPATTATTTEAANYGIPSPTTSNDDYMNSFFQY